MKGDNMIQLGFIEQTRKHISEFEVMLAYRGEVSQEIILALLEMTEKKLDSSKTDVSIKSKIFNVMVGCLQNINFHSAKNKHSKSNMFVIGRIENGFSICSGNAIRNNEVAPLKEKLDRINEMTETELKDFYQEWLTSRNLNEKKGIGLGLIDIARRTGNLLEFDFYEIDSEHCYFSLRTLISTHNNHLPGRMTEGSVAGLKPLSNMFRLFRIMKENEVILIYSGDFSQDLTKTLLAFTERKLSSEIIGDQARKKIFNIMVEMLQNISKNNVKTEAAISMHSPLFMIGETDSAYNLISSNMILNSNIQFLRNRIDEVNGLDAEGLKELYKQVRLKSTFSNVGGAGIGIIDMARKSENKLTYSFDETDSNCSMYSLLIKVLKNNN